jgi:hypothetical protein
MIVMTEVPVQLFIYRLRHVIKPVGCQAGHGGTPRCVYVSLATMLRRVGPQLQGHQVTPLSQPQDKSQVPSLLHPFKLAGRSVSFSHGAAGRKPALGRACLAVVPVQEDTACQLFPVAPA